MFTAQELLGVSVYNTGLVGTLLCYQDSTQVPSPKSQAGKHLPPRKLLAECPGKGSGAERARHVALASIWLQGWGQALIIPAQR